MAAPKWVADACSKMQGQFTSGANSFGQMAGIAALADLSETFRMNEVFKNRRDLVIKLLKEIDGFKINEPEGAFYLFPDISAILGKSYKGTKLENADVLCELILTEKHVALVSGSAFGVDNCIRIAYSASDKQLIEAVARIKEFVEVLQ